MAKRWNIKVRQGINIGRVITKVVVTLLSIYVGGIILDAIGDVIRGQESPLYKGLTLIGYTVGHQGTNASGAYATTCAGTTYNNSVAVLANCVRDTDGSGILTVIGIVGIASVVMEFVEFNMRM